MQVPSNCYGSASIGSTSHQGFALFKHLTRSDARVQWDFFAENSDDTDFVSAGLAWPVSDFPPEDSRHA